MITINYLYIVYFLKISGCHSAQPHTKDNAYPARPTSVPGLLFAPPHIEDRIDGNAQLIDFLEAVFLIGCLVVMVFSIGTNSRES